MRFSALSSAARGRGLAKTVIARRIKITFLKGFCMKNPDHSLKQLEWGVVRQQYRFMVQGNSGILSLYPRG
jgi:hypothetical protein